MGKIKFSNIGHGTGLVFQARARIAVSDEKQKPSEALSGLGRGNL